MVELLSGAYRVPDIVLARTPGEGKYISIPQKIVYHSPTGMEWGYAGSGPADLALNVLALFVDEQDARRLHQDFKFDVIAKIPQEGRHTLKAATVLDWLREHGTVRAGT